MLSMGDLDDFIEADRAHDGFVHAIDLEKTPKRVLKEMLKADHTHEWLYGTHWFSDLEEIKKLVEKSC